MYVILDKVGVEYIELGLVFVIDRSKDLVLEF